MAGPIRRLVVDSMKPHNPDMIDFATSVVECPGVDSVNAVLEETDRKVQDVKLTIAVDDIEASAVEETVDDLGGSVHSINGVVCGGHGIAVPVITVFLPG